MLTTNNHSFYKPQQIDDVVDTINKLSDNFEKLDELVDENTLLLDTHLVEGDTYQSGKRVWNSQPNVGDYVGWVNIRTGRYAPKWQSNKAYSLGDLVFKNDNNGHIYECVIEGTSAVAEPMFPTVADSTVLDTTNHTTWQADTVYNVGDIVIATVGGALYYYQCVNSGVSGSTEPSWTNVDGVTVNDNSTLWRTHKTVQWKEVGASCEFRKFGLIV
jgi:hypothetical protein